MVACELDAEVSGEVLGWKLPAWQALLLHRVLPSCGGLIVYLTVICFDLTLVAEHFQNGDDGLAAFCLILMILPAVLSLVFTLASPPPGLQTELSAYSVNVEKNDIKWIVMQFVNALFFPITAIGRYCYLIFWWIEAVCACRSGDEERTNEALLNTKEPSPVELYLFLQSFIHSAPHTIINILDLMARLSQTSYDKISVQSVSIVVSCLRMASTATIYRRFEREKLCGRKYPWSKKQDTEEGEKKPTDDNKQENETGDNKEPIYETPKRQSVVSQEQEVIQTRNHVISDMIKFSPTQIDHPMFFDDLHSDTSSDYLPPISPNDSSRKSPIYDSDDEYVRPITIIDRVAPRRRDTHFTIERVNITPPPAVPAPRPGSIAVWAEKIIENAESIPTWLQAPPRRKYYEVIQDEPDIPRRVPRSYLRGLEPQDATAALVHFLAWYAFFVSRLLSIAAFINFSPVIATILLFSHYQVMLLLLIVPQASTVKRGFYIFLAFIYLFCLMEFKIRFRHVRVWHAFWNILCVIEIVMFIGLWATIDNSMHDWWRSYVIKVTIVSLVLSYMCFLVYFTILKPRETIVHVHHSKVNK